MAAPGLAGRVPVAEGLGPERLHERRVPERCERDTVGLVTENLDVGKRFVADRIKSLRARAAAALGDGEGGVVHLDGDTVAAYRDEQGVLHAVAADCTHLGCRLSFATAERSWDCPCHGSRFDLHGHVLQGPAVEDLAMKDPT